jgi:hypothetical protein
MQRNIKLTPTADEQYSALEQTLSNAALFEQVRRAIGYLEIDPHHPSLHTNEFTSLSGPNGERIFKSYAPNKSPGAYRVRSRYGPDEIKGKKRVPVITILAITRQP